MTYGWREPDGAPLGGVELCDQCGFDARAVTDEPGELDHAFAQLARLLEHPDCSRRPQPEIFSAEEYVGHCVDVTRALLGLITDVTGIAPEDGIVDLPSARAASARVLPALTGTRRDARHTGTYSHDVSAGWIARHLLHDLAHHVLDIRCGYAKLALAELPGEWNAGRRGAGVQNDGIRQARLEDSTALGPLFDALGYPADETAIRRRLSRLGSDPSYASWVATREGAVVGFAAAHLVHPIEEDHPAAQLIALVTAPEHEGVGVGQVLCRQFETWARTNAARRLIVSSGDHRNGAHAFYERTGYTRTGIRFGKVLGEV